MTIDSGIQFLAPEKVIEAPRWAKNQRHFVLAEESALFKLLQWAREHQYHLLNIVVVDNRSFLDRTYKFYYLLSSAEVDELVVVEYGLPNPGQKEFSSVTAIFPSAVVFEHKIRDLFGLKIKNQNGDPLPGFLLHPSSYPEDFSPLSRRRTLSALTERLQNFSPDVSQVTFRPSSLSEGMLVVPVGPIHAGIIEAGHFPFHVAGEVIEKVPVTLGYKHRGVEKLFETHYTLQDGWKVAEKVCGDSAVAHAIAYCQAVEDLAQVRLSIEAYQWRALLLELERMYNHISDIGLLAVGIAYERAAAELAILRELFVHYINQALAGHRFLRGLNQPGKIVVPKNVNWSEIKRYLEAIAGEAIEWGRHLLQNPSARDRMLETGILDRDTARDAVGLAARASGWLDHDFRRRHPSPAYQDPQVQDILRSTVAKEETTSLNKSQVYEHDLQGDVFARLAIRVAELETSLQLALHWIDIFLKHSPTSLQVDIQKALFRTPELSMGIGYAEGWRGVVIYTLVKGTGNSIARCDICDPSLVNWHFFEKAVIRHIAKDSGGKQKVRENILADFPLINKSFNLSYSAHDL